MSMDSEPVETTAEWERRAPGWVFRCKRCGLATPYGKWGVRLGGSSRGKCMLAWCPRCRRLGCHRVQQACTVIRDNASPR